MDRIKLLDARQKMRDYVLEGLDRMNALEAVAEELALTPAEKEQVRIDVATNGLGF